MKHLMGWPGSSTVVTGTDSHLDPPMVPVGNRSIGGIAKQDQVALRIANDVTMTIWRDKCRVVLKWFPRQSSVVASSDLATIVIRRVGTATCVEVNLVGAHFDHCALTSSIEFPVGVDRGIFRQGNVFA